MKRARSSDPSSTGGGGDRRVRIARMLSAREASLYPRRDWGVEHIRRGSPGNIAKFGETWRSASADQRGARKEVGWTGRGKYGSHSFLFKGKG